MILKLDSKINNVDLSRFKEYVAWHPFHEFFPMLPGQQHHCLLAYLSSQLPEGSKVADLGTHIGSSALALASNPKVKVLTYDTHDMASGYSFKTYKNLPNIQFFLRNCVNDVDNYLDTKIIFLDIAPHDGIQEKQILDQLVEKKYKGIMICDDLSFPGMQEFWNSIKLKKIDATGYGHNYGTGIIIFKPDVLDVEMS